MRTTRRRRRRRRRYEYTGRHQSSPQRHQCYYSESCPHVLPGELVKTTSRTRVTNWNASFNRNEEGSSSKRPRNQQHPETSQCRVHNCEDVSNIYYGYPYQQRKAETDSQRRVGWTFIAPVVDIIEKEYVLFLAICSREIPLCQGITGTGRYLQSDANPPWLSCNTHAS